MRFFDRFSKRTQEVPKRPAGAATGLFGNQAIQHAFRVRKCRVGDMRPRAKKIAGENLAKAGHAPKLRMISTGELIYNTSERSAFSYLASGRKAGSNFGPDRILLDQLCHI